MDGDVINLLFFATLRKDWRQKKKRVAGDETVRQHHRLNGHESEQTPGDGGGQRSLVCPRGCIESDMT